MATKGPWKFMLEGRDHTSGDSFIMAGVKDGESYWSKGRACDIYITGATVDDCEFIAHSRHDIPKLIEEIKNLRHQLNNLASE